jgi:dTDP-4-amino-4,6-dideoxygalactose transaminase
MICVPPARHLYAQTSSGVYTSFDRDIIGERTVIYGNSWILLLGMLFQTMKRPFDNKSYIVVPNFCCNEFVKAILLAKCQPLFAEVNTHGIIDLLALETLLLEKGKSILAVMLANNTGKNADLVRAKSLCEANNVLLVEDAGYSIGGMNHKQQAYGTLSDVVIINLSEGKLLPVGGGALIVEPNLGLDFDPSEIQEAGVMDAIKDSISFGIYFLGSQNLFYTCHRLLKKQIGLDLKKSMSNELLRRNENYKGGDIYCDQGIWHLEASFLESIALAKLKSISRFKEYWLRKSYAGISTIKARRWRLFEYYTKALRGSFVLMEYDQGEVIVKIPILLKGVREMEVRDLHCFGVTKQYSEEWAYHLPLDFPISSKFFQQQFCLPVHEGISDQRAEKLVNYLLSKPHLFSQEDGPKIKNISGII